MAGKTTTTTDTRQQTQQQQNEQYAAQNDSVFGRSDRPIVTPEWMLGNTALWGNLGSTGLTQGQQTAAGAWADYLRNPENGVSQMIRGNAQLQPFTTPQANTAQGGGPVVANQAAAYSSAYRNPYEDQVVGSTIADLTKSFDRAQNSLRANYGGQGWSPTAGAPAGEQIAAAEGADNFLRTLGSTVGNLRSQGFDTANRFGAVDAGNALSASGQNADLSQRLSMFNASQGDTADARAIGTIQQMINNAGTQQQLGGQAVQQQYNMGGGGIAQLLAALGIQVPAFGSNAGGFNFADTSGVASGTSSGTTTGTGTETKSTSPGLGGILGALGSLATGLGSGGLGWKPFG